MLAIDNFNSEDLETIIANKKSSKVYIAIFFKFHLPLSFLAGAIGITKKGFGYWPNTLCFILFFLLVTIYLIVKENIFYNRDLKNKVKFTGTITVLKKSKKKNDCLIYTDSIQLNKLDVLFFEIFDQIEIGDRLDVEAAVSSWYIFKLNKGVLPLINGH